MAVNDDLSKLLTRAAPGVDLTTGKQWAFRRDGDALYIESEAGGWAFRLALAPEPEPEVKAEVRDRDAEGG